MILQLFRVNCPLKERINSRLVLPCNFSFVVSIFIVNTICVINFYYIYSLFDKPNFSKEATMTPFESKYKMGRDNKENWQIITEYILKFMIYKQRNLNEWKFLKQNNKKTHWKKRIQKNETNTQLIGTRVRMRIIYKLVW